MKRLRPLEVSSPSRRLEDYLGRIILTVSLLAALEKAKGEQDAHGEIESELSSYLGVQDTYYVGAIKGVGRIYQQTFIETYSQVASVKLYTEKTAITTVS